MPLNELASDPRVQWLVGGDEGAIPEAIKLGHFWTEIVFCAAVRGAKTFVACAAAVRMTQTVDTSNLTHGEFPRVSILSTHKDNAKTAFNYLKGAFENTWLKSLLVGEPTTDTILVRGIGNKPIEIKCVAGAKSGSTLVSRWCAGVIFDEAPRMNGPEAVVNLEDSRDAVIDRLLPGAQALYIGSPWKPYGLVYDLVEKHWKNPDDDLAVLRATGPMLNPSRYTEEFVEKLRKKPRAYQVSVRGEFVDEEEGLLDVDSLDAVTRKWPEFLAPDPCGIYSAGVDPSEGSANGNAFTLVIVQRTYEENQTRYRVAYAKEYRNMRPKAIWEQIADQCKRYGIFSADTDQYAAAANADLAAGFGLALEVKPNSNRTNVEGFTNLSTLVQEGAIELPPSKVMRRDLLSVSMKATQKSVSVVLPKTSDGRHCDFAPALVKALQAGLESTNPLIEAMRERIRRRQANGTA